MSACVFSAALCTGSSPDGVMKSSSHPSCPLSLMTPLESEPATAVPLSAKRAAPLGWCPVSPHPLPHTNTGGGRARQRYMRETLGWVLNNLTWRSYLKLQRISLEISALSGGDVRLHQIWRRPIETLIMFSSYFFQVHWIIYCFNPIIFHNNFKFTFKCC